MRIKSHKDLVEGKPSWEENWDHTLANKLELKGEVVIVTTVRRWGKDSESVKSLEEFDAWRAKLVKLEEKEKRLGVI